MMERLLGMYNVRFKLDSPADCVVLLNTSVVFVCQRTVYYQSESLLSLDNETPSLYVGVEVVNSWDDISSAMSAHLRSVHERVARSPRSATLYYTFHN
jgi:hypothetical protein